MRTNPLLEKIRQNKRALGIGTQDPHSVELLANLGLDFFRFDQMFTDTDWDKSQTLLWAAEAAGITPIVRLQSYPWLGYDRRIAAELSRAQGIGAQFIFISHSCNKEIEDALVVSKDWHRRALTVHPFKDQQWAETIEKIGDEVYIIPHAESKDALETMEETMAMPGIKMYFLAMTDASLIITGEKNPDFSSPKLWKYLKQVVASARKHGVYVGINTSYAYTVAEMRQRINKLYEAGFNFVSMQNVPFIFKVAMSELLEGVQSDSRL